MLSEIGSNFWLNPNEALVEKPFGTPEQFNCKGSDYAWLSTGRSAIQFVINLIEERNPNIKKVAVLPSFTCDTVFEPFLKSGYEVFYYPIERDLRTTSDDILETVIKQDASIVLFHRYFGFDTLDGQVDRMCEVLRELGKYTIEDCTQCLYSGIFRDKDLEEAKIRASYAKYRYLFEHKGDKGEMLAMYRSAEDILNNQEEIYNISEMSAKVQANLDLNEVKRKRRANFELLSKELKQYVKPVFTLEDREVPLYFPVLVDDRGALQKHLVANAIYAPLVWPKDDKQLRQCDGAENAYEHLLCIPIDQRYGLDDMKRIVEVINDFYKK